MALISCKCGKVKYHYVAAHGDTAGRGATLVPDRREPDCIGCDECGTTLHHDLAGLRPKIPHDPSPDNRCLRCHMIIDPTK